MSEVCECGHHRTDHIYEEGACRPGFRCEDDCNAFKSADTPIHGGPLETRLLESLAKAEVANQHARSCQVCVALRAMSEEARSGVERALAGTIGERKLADILTDAGYTTGRRAVQNHRREAHTP